MGSRAMGVTEDAIERAKAKAAGIDVDEWIGRDPNSSPKDPHPLAVYRRWRDQHPHDRHPIDILHERQFITTRELLSNMQEWIKNRALDSATAIDDTDYNDVQGAIQNGVDEGLGVAEIATAIRNVSELTPFRAATIARTETHAAASYGAIAEARQSADELGITLQKQWLPTLDNRTRPEHAAMNNSPPIPLDDKFIVGGEEMDRPGDPAGSPENTINCRSALAVTEAPAAA